MTSPTPFRDVPVNRSLGMELVERSPDSAVVRIADVTPFVQEHGVVHGGILSTLADTAAVYTFHPELQPGHGMTSIEFKMNFLRPALPEGGPLTARSNVVRKGRRVGSCEVDVMQAERVVARGWFTYMFLSPEGG